jgi:hypothetical protein
VAALGRLSEALEVVERARGHLYEFHQLSGRADLKLQEATELLRDAGHPAVAEALNEHLVGRNVIDGRWTFQLVEDYDDTYWSVFRDMERNARNEVAGGLRHLFEAEMKRREQGTS